MGKKRRVARLAEEAARKGRAEWEEDGMIFLQVEAFGEPRTFLWPVTLDQSWRIFPARRIGVGVEGVYRIPDGLSIEGGDRVSAITRSQFRKDSSITMAGPLSYLRRTSFFVSTNELACSR